MKICLNCGHGFSSDRSWNCHACGKSQSMVDGIIRLAEDFDAGTVSYPQAHLDTLARLQDSSFWFRARNALIAMLVREHFAGAQRVLEVGCGSGAVLVTLREVLPDAQLVGSEAYVLGLQRTRERLDDDVELIQCDARRLPYSAEFDLIGAFDVLEHVAEDGAVIGEAHRALRPGGGLLLTVPQHMRLWSRFDIGAGHVRRYEKGELEAKCRKAGFSILRSTSFVTTLLPFVALSRRLNRFQDSDTRFAPHLLPRPLNATLEVVLRLELRLIRAGVNLPFGLSRVVVARKG